ncbi:MAG: DUF896 domain-containing protein [Oscillospiraceae bacterium]|nr:DUF896 domain-containing protein [Oscillospiraceae bacterium]
MEQHKIDRINALARKAKTEGLTGEEQAERDALRREYIASYVGDLRGQLENMYVVDGHGQKRKLRRKEEQ